MTLPLLNLNLYERTLTSTPGAIIADLAMGATSYAHTITDQGGFESATIALSTTLDQAYAYTDRLLCPLIAYGPDGDIAWEGYLSSVSFRVGGEDVSVSLDGMANVVRARWVVRGLGTPQTPITATSADSVATYGTKQTVISAGAPTDSAAATSLANAVLFERAWPITRSASAIETGGGDAAVAVTLAFAGWYTTLDWVTLERTDTSVEQTTAQVGTLIGTSAPGIGAINPFLSTSTAQITPSGVNDTRQVDADTTYRAKIEALLSRGISGVQRMAWGVYEGREFIAGQWAGGSPTTTTYRTRIGDATVRTNANQVVRPWLVRPNSMVVRSDLVDLFAANAAIVDTGARYYCARVAFSLDGNGWRLSLEGSDQRSADALIARMG